ncbi:AAA family ATPase [Limnochorda pilosa]|uniref:Stage V sporulation protein K n=1 Tax=Limnochorda pilosa TaxID=1555112 RepID=A0A0K2SL58_LIMPI|nr:AAA family ATPase [Limnochorda pilosa]BAS27579.1 stage V sporulation protein K [Limnochorda pilosa]
MAPSGLPDPWEELLARLARGEVASHQVLASWNQTAPERPSPRAAPGRGDDRGGDDASGDPSLVEASLHELDQLIGLREVGSLVREITALVEIQRRRAAHGLRVEPLVFHMVFKGNPGTGKTTVARILGRLFKGLGVLPQGHLVEVERADLVGEYIGHTAQKTREQVKKAMGGVLFVDEAYALARGGEKDFGKEAVDTLVKAMEDHRDQFVLILAGYRVEMELFLQMNPGLRSRFPIHMDFPDYTGEELLQIARSMAAQRQYRLSPSVQRRLARMLGERRLLRGPTFGNAREVRNLLEAAIRRQAVRLVRQERTSRDDLMLLSAEDFLEGGPA